MEDYKKKYEQAMLRMSKWVEGSEITDPKEVAEFVFPELKESDDERIKKGIVYLIRCVPEIEWCKADVSIGEVQTWLEKQGEQKPIWSKEDYDEMGVIACHLDNMGNEAMAKSLLCIRDKYNVKSKPAWSEEDEKQARQIERIVHDNGCTHTLQKQIADWLKSLKERMKGE